MRRGCTFCIVRSVLAEKQVAISVILLSENSETSTSGIEM